MLRQHLKVLSSKKDRTEFPMVTSGALAPLPTKSSAPQPLKPQPIFRLEPLVPAASMRISRSATETKPGLVQVTAVLAVIVLSVLATGCTQANHSQRTFFRDEYGLETHGRKTWFDHLVEADPGGIEALIVPDYDQVAPAKIAVLPFTDRGSAQFVVDKIPLTRRNAEEQANWAWTDANRMRRAIHGDLASREFLVENIIQVDRVMKEHYIYDAAHLNQVSPQMLGKWLGVDAVVYGEVTHYEAYYAALVSGWQLGIKVKMVSTRDGRELFSADGSRYCVDLRLAFDPLGILLNSGLSLLELRDITLARAEEESAREIALRVPRSERLRAELIEEASDRPDLGKRQDASLQIVQGPALSSDVGNASILELHNQ
jgi:hypothetical protein